MSVELKMPALSPTMEQGTLARWLVAEGDLVKSGDLLAEIETDKATMELEAIDDGRIGQLLVPAGTADVAVGTVIATMDSADNAAPVTAETEVAPPTQVTSPVPTASAAQTAPAPHMTVQSGRVLDDQVSATPLAKRIAAALDINLARITGTGPRGKIVKADLGLAPASTATSATLPATTTSLPIATFLPPPAGVPVEALPLSGMRKTIARRLTESKQTIPHFYLTARCNLDALLKLRGQINADLVDQGIKISVNDMLIKGLAGALCEVPDANVQFGGEELHRFQRVDISMAVAIPGGLITPVIKDAGSSSVSSIARQAKALAQMARDGKLKPEDYQGGTASISNLGMFGIDEMFPVINPPQALILGIGAGVEQPWKVDGAVALATIMAATASFDHRAIDGSVAAQFMAAFRDLVESPMRLLA